MVRIVRMELEPQQRVARERRGERGVPCQRGGAAPGVRAAVDDALAHELAAIGQQHHPAQRAGVGEVDPAQRFPGARAHEPGRGDEAARHQPMAGEPAHARGDAVVRLRERQVGELAFAPRVVAALHMVDEVARHAFVQVGVAVQRDLVAARKALAQPGHERSRARCTVVARDGKQRERHVGDVGDRGDHPFAGVPRGRRDVVQHDRERRFHGSSPAADYRGRSPEGTRDGSGAARSRVADA